MNDPVFLPPVAGLSLAEIVALTGAQGSGDLAAIVYAVAPLEIAGLGDLSFYDPAGEPSALAETHATACLMTPAHVHQLAPAVIPLLTHDPAGAAALVLAKLFPSIIRPESSFEAVGVSPGAMVHPDARLEAGVRIDPGAVIGPRAEIGSGSIIGANSLIGPDVRIGRECSIGSGVSVSHALIGNQVVLAPGVCLGQAPVLTDWPVAPGRVIIQDKAIIGANSTIDRGVLRDTVIGEGTMIGALAVIGPDVNLGRFCRVPPRSILAAMAQFDDRSILEHQTFK